MFFFSMVVALKKDMHPSDANIFLYRVEPGLTEVNLKLLTYVLQGL